MARFESQGVGWGGVGGVGGGGNVYIICLLRRHQQPKSVGTLIIN